MLCANPRRHTHSQEHIYTSTTCTSGSMGELLPLSVFERITGEFLPLSAPQGGCAPGELPISEPLPRRNSPAMTCKNEVPSCWTVAEDLCWLILESLSKISACTLLCAVCLCVFIVSRHSQARTHIHSYLRAFC